MQSKYFLYVGAYGKGVNGYRFDTTDGSLQSIGLTGTVVNPSFLAADKEFRYLYAVSEVEGNNNGGVAAFAIDRDTGELRHLNDRDSGGVAPCHLVVDATGKMLMVANYTSGGVSAFPIGGDGSLGPMSALKTADGHGPNAKRQEGPHAHEVVLTRDNRILYVPDLGLDRIRMYDIDPARASLSEHSPSYSKQDPGMGPRHIVFSHDESVAYVINELIPAVSVFRHDKTTGELSKMEDVPTVPAGFHSQDGPAEILLDDSGRHLYASNRGNDTVVVFSVGADANLTHVQTVSSEGKMPRGLAFDPSGAFVFAGNQKSNNFVVFRVDAASGRLTPTGQAVNTPSPVAFLFVPAQ